MGERLFLARKALAVPGRHITMAYWLTALSVAGAIALGEEPHLIGIVNCTPDSFSDGGRLPDVTAAVDHALRLLADGDAMAAYAAAEAAIEVTGDALRMLGAGGYADQEPLERMYHDVRMVTIGGGTAQILRTVIASRILERTIASRERKQRGS